MVPSQQGEIPQVSKLSLISLKLFFFVFVLFWFLTGRLFFRPRLEYFYFSTSLRLTILRLHRRAHFISSPGFSRSSTCKNIYKKNIYINKKTLHLGYILNTFLRFRKFQPHYSYKVCEKKKSVSHIVKCSSFQLQTSHFWQQRKQQYSCMLHHV